MSEERERVDMWDRPISDPDTVSNQIRRYTIQWGLPPMKEPEPEAKPSPAQARAKQAAAFFSREVTSAVHKEMPFLTSPQLDFIGLRIEQIIFSTYQNLEQENERLLQMVQRFYVKHHLNIDAEGWQKLAEDASCVLAETMGDKELQQWVESEYPEALAP